MKSILFLFGLSLPLIIADPSSAEPQAKDRADPCGNKNSERDYADCYNDLMDLSQKALSETFESLHRTYLTDEPGKARILTESQRTWMEYRDAHCRLLDFDSLNGTASGVYLNICAIEFNNRRLKDLKKIADMP